MIINTGRRTDIPAFYSEWLLNRIREGYVMVRNPFYRHQVTKYSLNPDVVDCLAFCTKNPRPLLAHLDELDKYNQFWFVTINPYGKDIETNVPNKRHVISDFKKLSKHLGKNAVALRYDPIFINDKFDVNMHIKCFEELITKLKGYTEDCTISFIDIDDKNKMNIPGLRAPTEEEQIEIAKAFSRIGKNNNITVHACCEMAYLKYYGLDITGCMSREVVEKAIGNKLNGPKSCGKRGECNCLLGNDIGAYNTCMHLCKYCYANTNKDLVKENIKKHDPNSPFLIGGVEEDDRITEAKQKSWIARKNSKSILNLDDQISFFN